MKAMFCDMYNFQVTGDIAATINASSCDSPGHSGPSLLILNDQGGDVMNVDEDITATLRAQDHGHPPVVCFAECNSHLYISEESSQTIRAESHGALPIVCIGFDVYNMQNTGEVSKTLNSVATDSDHVPVVCFQLCGDRDNPSVSLSDKAYCIPANPMSDRGQAVCYMKQKL